MGAHLVGSGDIDLSDNATFAQGFPHDHFTWARDHAPVYWHERRTSLLEWGYRQQTFLADVENDAIFASLWHPFEG